VTLLPCRAEVPLCVRADPQRLKQVLLNLLSNAIKYNRRGGEVSLCCRSVEGNRLRIEVADTGLGIAAEDMETIFAPFARLPVSYGVEGTGLGLSLSKTLIEAMGGVLGVSSEPGRGSIFWVEFACAASLERPASAGGDGLPAIELEAFGLHGATLLCIEDNLANLQLVEHLLAQDHDLRLITARQGRTGVELARERQPDLILLDLHLPDMNGEEVLRALRRAPETAEVPVIVISEDATLEQVRRLCLLGACDYLTKPFDIQELRRAIDEALQAELTA
jgi:CheY-like chemotaxis protein/anti-sigma regulatory factor (Ser/Thr protein kinase)